MWRADRTAVAAYVGQDHGGAIGNLLGERYQTVVVRDAAVQQDDDWRFAAGCWLRSGFDRRREQWTAIAAAVGELRHGKSPLLPPCGYDI